MKACSCVIVSFFVASFVATSAFGSPQNPDFLVYEGKTYELLCDPLEAYFSDENPKPEAFRENWISSCVRGYIAKWKIEDGWLYLVSLWSCEDVEFDEKIGFWAPTREIPITTVFKDARGPVKATWYSGGLHVPQGKMVKEAMGFGSTYTKSLYLMVEKGKIVGRELVERTPEDGSWFYLRHVVTTAFNQMRATGTEFHTRGLFYSTAQTAGLRLPATDAGEAVELPFAAWPPDVEIADGTPVEVAAEFVKDEEQEDAYGLHVSAIRPLKADEPYDKQPPQTTGNESENKSAPTDQ
jgi:hypothetical protein